MASSASSSVLARHECCEIRVQDPDDGERQRQPGSIEQGGDHRPDQGLAQACQVAYRLGCRPVKVRGLHRGREEPGLESGGDPGQKAGPHPIENTHDDQRHDAGEAEQRQRLDPAGAQHAVIELEAVEGHCQHQQVEEQAEEPSP